MSIFPRIAVPAAVGLIAALSLVGCSGNDADMDSESNVGAPASTPDTELPEDEVASEEDESVNDSGNESEAGSSVEQLCREVDQFVTDFRSVLENPTEQSGEEFQEQLDQLSKTALTVAQDTTLSPAERERSRECSEKLASLGAE